MRPTLAEVTVEGVLRVFVEGEALTEVAGDGQVVLTVTPLWLAMCSNRRSSMKMTWVAGHVGGW